MVFIGAPVNIHPGFSEESPFQILDILEEAGGDISRTVISHLDRTITDDDVLLKLAKRGCYLEYDMFGNECSNYQVSSPLYCNYSETLINGRLGTIAFDNYKDASFLGRLNFYWENQQFFLHLNLVLYGGCTKFLLQSKMYMDDQ